MPPAAPVTTTLSRGWERGGKGGIGIIGANAFANPACRKFASTDIKKIYIYKKEKKQKMQKKKKISGASARGEPAECPHLEGMGRNSARGISFTSSSLSITGKYKSVAPINNNQ
jgi:hypothetical protein